MKRRKSSHLRSRQNESLGAAMFLMLLSANVRTVELGWPRLEPLASIARSSNKPTGASLHRRRLKNRSGCSGRTP